MIILDRDLCFIDCETLGLDIEAPIWEVAAIRLRADGTRDEYQCQILHHSGNWLDTLPAQFAVMPVRLAQRCIAAGCKPGGVVLDPFSGSGTTGLAAQRLGRKYIGIDLNSEYLDLSLRTRLNNAVLDFDDSEVSA